MSRQTVEFSITAAEKLNETLNAFLEIDREGALQRATELEQSGHVGPLSGVPVAIKDNICVKGLQASCGTDFHGVGESRLDFGELPPLPAGVDPVWSRW